MTTSQVCPRCEYSTTLFGSMKKHLERKTICVDNQKKTPEEFEKFKKTYFEEKPKHKYTCNTCDKGFTSKAVMENHIENCEKVIEAAKTRLPNDPEYMLPIPESIEDAPAPAPPPKPKPMPKAKPEPKVALYDDIVNLNNKMMNMDRKYEAKYNELLKMMNTKTINNTNTNNISIRCFGEENIARVINDVMKSCMSADVNNGLKKLINDVNASPSPFIKGTMASAGSSSAGMIAGPSGASRAAPVANSSSGSSSESDSDSD